MNAMEGAVVSRLLCGLMAALLAAPVPAQEGGAGRDLEAGIRQVNAGELEAAVLTLDGVIQKLTAAPATDAASLARAHLYKGVALVGLLQEEPAKASFREALRYDPALRMAKGQFPDRVVRVFEAARTAKAGSVIDRPGGTAKKAGLGVGVILGIVAGVLAAGGAAALASQGGTPANRPPGDIRIDVSPAGPALVGATNLTFTASASDPDGDALTFNWSFGEGQRASGQTVMHVYNVQGTHTVEVNVSDGNRTAGGGSTSATTSIIARVLGGCWRDSSSGAFLFVTFHEGAQFSGSLSDSCAPGSAIVQGIVGNPRNITTLTIAHPSGALSYVGQLDAALDVMTLTCTSSPCPGQASYRLLRIG